MHRRDLPLPVVSFHAHELRVLGMTGRFLECPQQSPGNQSLLLLALHYWAPLLLRENAHVPLLDSAVLLRWP